MLWFGYGTPHDSGRHDSPPHRRGTGPSRGRITETPRTDFWWDIGGLRVEGLPRPCPTRRWCVYTDGSLTVSVTCVHVRSDSGRRGTGGGTEGSNRLPGRQVGYGCGLGREGVGLVADERTSVEVGGETVDGTPRTPTAFRVLLRRIQGRFETPMTLGFRRPPRRESVIGSGRRT